ncbi:E3 ubiquitin-protein ligase HECTD1 [Clonorchis sinensis]|uniref:E3 ubiquitin-protein ligase n=1 Tax=Clonorchis sinensis TaxID=79923 RepID=G7YKK2_CLOSI|nr:E3 ubiquitin-protein ligase HECTD1 [Clonorchis sinensis]
MTQNWLAEALLPTFSRVVPFLFASCTPKLLREPPVTRHRSSSSLMTAASEVNPSLEHKENSQTMTSHWEDAGSFAVEDVTTGRGPHSQSDISEVVNDEASFPEKFMLHTENKLATEPEHKEHPNGGSFSGNLLKTFPSPSQPTLSMLATEAQLSHDGFVELEGAPLCHLSACTDAYVTVLPASPEMAIDSDDAEDGGVNEEVNYVDVGEYENDANELNEDLSRSLGFESSNIQEASVTGPETHYDEELDAIDNALEQQILKNIEENGFIIEAHGSLCGPSKIPKHHGYRKFLKFDDYENRDPICISSLVQQCMNIDILGSEKCKQVIPRQRATQSQQAAEGNQPSCSAYTTNNQSKLLPPHLYNEASFSASGAENSEQTAPTVLYQKTAEADQQNLVIPGEKCLSSLPSSRHALANFRAPTNKPLASIPTSAPKQLTRLQPSDGVRVENIESTLNGLIPPFETRTGTSHLPSIATFTIPMRVQWPPDGLCTNESPSLRVGKSKTPVYLRLRQEEATDPLGGFSCSVVTLTSSGSSSVSNTPQKICESVSSNLENDHATSSTRNMGPEDVQRSENIPDAYNLNNPDVHLVHYLLKYADHVEDFPGSGVLRGPGTHLAKLWNRTYFLDYQLDGISEDQLREANLLSGMVPVRKSAEISESGLAPQVFVDPSSLEQLLELLAAIHEYLNLTSSQGERSRRDRLQAVCQSSCPIVKAAAWRGQSESDDPMETEVTAFLEGMQPKGSADVDPSMFISSRLTRKLTSYSRDVWSVLSNIHTLTSPHESDGTSNKFKWMTRLTTDYKFLFPFETRLEFWRVSSLGTSRAIAWLQKRTGNSRVSNNHLLGVGSASFSQRIDATTHHARDRGGKILTPDANFSWTPSVVIVPNPVTSQNSQIENDLHLNKRFSEPTNSVGFGIPPPPNLFGIPSGGAASSLMFGLNSHPPLAGLGRLQRHMARVPRPQPGTTLSDPNHESSDDNNVEQTLIRGTTYSFFSGGNNFWAAAVRLLLAHADMRQELEVEFEGEEGTGLGPTMEFYALLSAELRRHSHGLWVSEDRNEEPSMLDYDQKIEEAKLSFDSKMDLIEYSEDGNVDFYQKESVEETHAATRSIKEDGDFYVNPAMGLFPAPWPQDQLPPGAELRFYVLGVAVAKCLLDQRQMDLPFSNAFLTLLCQFNARLTLMPRTDQARKEWPGDVLDLNDFVDIYPERGKFLKTLISYIQERRLLSNQMTPEEFDAADLDIQRRLFSAELEALCISMSFAPATRKFGQTEFQLTSAYDPTFLKNADDIPTSEEFLTAATAEQFIRRSVEFALHKGIRKQMCAFKAGFERVLPLASLATFTPYELGRLIFGESCPEWTPQEIWANCEPAAGYTRQSSGFRMFIESLSSFDVSERRAFLRFVTGCPTLPPGGLRNLHPKLKVARKDGTTCGPFPSVNTCMHYLKLPEYRSVTELKKYLLAAANQRGFFLN